MSDVRDIDITLTVDGEKRHPTSITLTSRINGYPTLQVTHHADFPAESAADVSSGDVAKDMGKRQTLMFKERSAPDVKLHMGDGNGGSLDFSGLLTSPAHSFSSSNVDQTDLALPIYALMESLDFSCYQLAAQDIEVLRMKPTLADVKSIPELFYKRAMELQKKWEELKGGYSAGTSALEKKAREAQHGINKKAVKPFQKLMTGSTESFGWEELKEWVTRGSGVCSDKKIRERMDGLLSTSSGSFFTTLCKFAEEYQCLYVPEWDNVGKLVNRNKLFKDPEDYKAEVVELTLSAGTRGLFPTRYVAVAPSVSVSDIDTEIPTSGFVAYPMKSMQAGGTAIRNPGPPWLPSWLAADSVRKDGASPQSLEDGMEIKEIESGKKEKKEDKKDYTEKTSSILKEWAKSVYIWQSLGTSSAAINVPLDLNVKVGKRYNVTSAKGEQVFSGFLQSVTHTVTCTPGNGSANTQLAFSHVAMPGFKLPMD